MTGYTNPDLLPYPNDYNQPADVPTAVRDLANATQLGLDSKPDLDHVHPMGDLPVVFGSITLATLAPGAVGTSAPRTVPAGSVVFTSVAASKAGVAVTVTVTGTTATLRYNNLSGSTLNNVVILWMAIVP